MNISIIGAGYVGLVTSALFSEKGHNVLCIENNLYKLDKLKKGEIPFYEPGLKELVQKNVAAGKLNFDEKIARGVEYAQVIFVAVGTPPLPTGEADMTYIERVAVEIASSLNEYRLIVEKSTVPVHTSEKIRLTMERYAQKDVAFEVASNPEFLREGQALEDAFAPDRIVIGVPSPQAEKIMSEVYQDFDVPIIFTNVNSAEIIKHAANSFLAMKISYINAVANICEIAGANIEQVAKGIGLDSRIGQNFLNAGIGYGGSCFPKDVDAFVSISSKLGYDFTLLKEVQKINKMQRQLFIKKIKEELWVVNNKTIAIWGLSFKPNTDDMREAPSIEIIESLKEQGAKIRLFDPEAISKANEILEREEIFDNTDKYIKSVLQGVNFCKDPYDAVTGADCIVLVTEWDIFRDIDFDKVKELMNQCILIDGRNLYCPDKLKEKGFTYRSIGR